MFHFVKSKPISMLGVDIGSTAIKIVELSIKNHCFCLEAYGHAGLPERSIEGRLIKNIDAVASTIRSLLTMVSSKNAAVAIPDAFAMSKTIQMHHTLNEEGIETWLSFDSDKYIPYPMDEVHVDFNVLGPSTEQESMVDVLIVASKKEYVDSRAEALRRAGLYPALVDIESFALARAIQLLSFKQDITIALVDIGAAHIRLFVFSNRRLIFSREDPFVGPSLANLAMHRYDLSEHGAECLDGVLSMVNEALLLQIKRALHFFETTVESSVVTRLFLTGGMANQTTLVKCLESNLSIPVQMATPLLGMEVSENIDRSTLNQEASLLMVACGLAQRCMA